MPKLPKPPRGPRHDFGPGSRSGGGDLRSHYPPARKKRRKGGEPDEGGVPVEPNRPSTLSGGAAAALEFEGE